MWTKYIYWRCVDRTLTSCSCLVRFQAGAIICVNILKVCWSYSDGMGWEARCCHVKYSSWWAEYLVSYDSTCCITHIIINISQSFSYHGTLTITQKNSLKGIWQQLWWRRCLTDSATCPRLLVLSEIAKVPIAPKSAYSTHIRGKWACKT